MGDNWDSHRFSEFRSIYIVMDYGTSNPQPSMTMVESYDALYDTRRIIIAQPQATHRALTV